MLIMSQIVDNIKDLMISENLSQDAFAAKIGVDDSTVSYWLKGTKLPDIRSIIKIAQTYGYSTDFILGLTEKSDFQPSENSKTFFDRFPLLLKESNLNKNRLAKILGVGNSAVSKWILHRHMPSTEKVVKLSELLNCSVDFLIGRSDNK